MPFDRRAPYHTLVLGLSLALLSQVNSGQAAITPTGDVSPAYPVANPDPWDEGGDLYVGYDAPATLRIDAVSVVNNTNGVLARFESSTGEVTVNGPGSAWNNSGVLLVGRSGDGTLNIEDGGTVTNQTFGYLGLDNTVTGTVHVSGAGSAWNNTGELHAGRFGTGILNIENGATATTDGISYLGYAIGSTGTVSVTGTGSSWDANNDLHIGNIGNGTLNIEDGATASNTGVSQIGRYTGSTGNVTVMGTDSLWDNTNSITVGGYGAGTLNIENGATVSTGGTCWLARSPGSTGTATVTGTGSVLNIANYLVIGSGGTGTLNILNGGVVTTEVIGEIGRETGSTGTVIVTGDGSSWNLEGKYGGNLTVGDSGTGTLRIEDGGAIRLDRLYLGSEPGSTGMASITGVGSILNGFNTIVGLHGTSTLRIDNGAAVNFTNGLFIGLYASGNGKVELLGGTLDLNGSDLTKGEGTAMFIYSGGTLKDAGSIQLGKPFAQDGGTLAPGSSIGQTDIVGDYDLNAGAVEIELGGVGDPIDLVTATGDIDITTLGTTLDLRALGPMAAGTYTLMQSTGGTITGIFENINNFNLFGVNLSVVNTGSAITVTLDNDLIFADSNLDGFVGIDDLNIVLAGWNQTVPAGDVLSGDLTGDGFVGIKDLNAVLGHWNQGTPPTEVFNTVPEPGCMAVVLLGMLGALSRRCRTQ